MDLISVLERKRAQGFRAALLLWLERVQRATLLATAFLFSAGYSTVGILFLFVTLVVEGDSHGQSPLEE